MVLIGIGLVPSDELARASGIDAPNGIKVDERLATSDENVFAIGDTVYHYNTHRGAEMRLESVQNATDQARTLAKLLVGKPANYDHVRGSGATRAILNCRSPASSTRATRSSCAALTKTAPIRSSASRMAL